MEGVALPGQPTVIKFSEPDEQLAVAKFHSIRGRSVRSSEVKFRVAKYPTAAEAVTAGKELVNTVAAGVAVLEQNLERLGSAPVSVDFGALLDRPEVWAWVRRQIIDNPKLAAQKLAIDEVGYLTDLKPPTPSLTVTAGQVYANFAKVSAEERTRVVRAWGEFAKLAGVNAVNEIDQTAAERYKQALDKLEFSPKARKTGSWPYARRWATAFVAVGTWLGAGRHSMP